MATYSYHYLIKYYCNLSFYEYHSTTQLELLFIIPTTMIKLKNTVNRYNTEINWKIYTCKFELGTRLYFDISIWDWRDLTHLSSTNR